MGLAWICALATLILVPSDIYHAMQVGALQHALLGMSEKQLTTEMMLATMCRASIWRSSGNGRTCLCQQHIAIIKHLSPVQSQLKTAHGLCTQVAHQLLVWLSGTVYMAAAAPGVCGFWSVLYFASKPSDSD